MTCDEFDAQLAAYHDRTLNALACDTLEAHAATCDRCGHSMERATAGTLPAFAPSLPAALRTPVLRAVAARRQRSRAIRIASASGLLGAAALLAVMLQPSRKQAQIAVADSIAVAPVIAADAADDRSRSEFMALDDAARELESALARAPNDPQLSAFLQSVSARRVELRQRVKDSRS